MGGSIRSGLYSKVTHLICNTSSGSKYQYAMTFRLDVVRPTWVHTAWEQRDMPTFDASHLDFTHPHRLKPFEGQKICFLGFPEDEHQHMIEVLTANGGVSTKIDDPECSHVVSEEIRWFLGCTVYDVLCIVSCSNIYLYLTMDRNQWIN